MPHNQIQKGVPIDVPLREQLPVAEMEVGDSFTVPYKQHKGVTSMLTRVQRKTGWRFRTRKEDSVTLRVWRIS